MGAYLSNLGIKSELIHFATRYVKLFYPTL